MGADLQDALAVDEGEAVGRTGDHADGEGDRRHDGEASVRTGGNGAEVHERHVLGVVRRLRDRAQQRHDDEHGHQRDSEEPPKRARSADEPVQHRRQPGPDPRARRHDDQAVNPSARARELHGDHLHQVDAAESNGRARAKQSTKNQYEGLRAAAAVASRPRTRVRWRTRVRPPPIGERRQGHGAQRREAQRRQPEPEYRAREPNDTLRAIGPMSVAEVSRNVVQRSDGAELSERRHERRQEEHHRDVQHRSFRRHHASRVRQVARSRRRPPGSCRGCRQ